MDQDGPPPEAYGRVTNPERFAPLHTVADGIVDELTSTHNVVAEQLRPSDAHDGEGHIADLLRWDRTERAVRLDPGGAAAPLVIVWTNFPGITIVAGAHGRETFPACGCDACDDDVERLIEDLRDALATVAAGGYQEYVAYPGQRSGPTFPFGTAAGRTRLARARGPRGPSWDRLTTRPMLVQAFAYQSGASSTRRTPVSWTEAIAASRAAREYGPWPRRDTEHN